jgi:hypothetical protein
MTHKLFHTAAWLYIKVSPFCTTQSRLVSVNVADETPTYKTGLCKYLEEGHTEVNKYKKRRTDFVNALVLKAEKKTMEINIQAFVSSTVVENVWSVSRSGLIIPGIGWVRWANPIFSLRDVGKRNLSLTRKEILLLTR